MKIAVLGTCRVHDPINSVENEPGISILTPQNSSYLHTSSEALQRISYLIGKYEYPQNLTKYQIGKGVIDLIGSQKIDDADIVLIEVSYIKLLSIETHFLQFNHTIKRIRKLDGAFCNEWLIMLDSSFSSGEPIPKITNFPPSISQAEREVISGIMTRKQTQIELEDDIRNISSLLGKKVIFVTHVGARKKNGLNIKSREYLISRISDCCSKFDIPVINPTEFLDILGQENMMAEDGMDTNHYAPDKLGIIGSKLLERVRNLRG